jgi:hypothetical protein
MAGGVDCRREVYSGARASPGSGWDWRVANGTFGIKRLLIFPNDREWLSRLNYGPSGSKRRSGSALDRGQIGEGFAVNGFPCLYQRSQVIDQPSGFPRGQGLAQRFLECGYQRVA